MTDQTTLEVFAQPSLAMAVETEVAIIAQLGGVAVAIVTAIGLILVAIVNRTRQHSKAVRVQVENDHSTNFRDELDTRHTEILEKVDGAMKAIAALGKSVGSVRDDLRQVRDELQGEREDRLELRRELRLERERISALEDTQPRPHKPKDPS